MADNLAEQGSSKYNRKDDPLSVVVGFVHYFVEVLTSPARTELFGAMSFNENNVIWHPTQKSPSISMECFDLQNM